MVEGVKMQNVGCWEAGSVWMMEAAENENLKKTL
jgi:hypothetical protein